MDSKPSFLEFITSQIKLIKPSFDGKLNSDTELSNIGFDDIDFIELTIEIEEEYDLLLNESIVSELKTIGDVVEYVELQARYN
jgi:acyl carrier protein